MENKHIWIGLGVAVVAYLIFNVYTDYIWTQGYRVGSNNGYELCETIYKGFA